MQATLPGVIEVDLRTSRRGVTSQLGAEIGARPLLVRTIERLRGARGLDPLVLLVREEQAAELRALLGGLEVEIAVHRHDDLPRRADLRRARLWSKEGWRGGIAGTYFASEEGNPLALEALCRERRWPAVMLLPAAAPFIDPTLIDEMVEAYSSRDPRQCYLSTAPPGLAGDIFFIEALAEMARRGGGVETLLPLRWDEGASPYEQVGVFHLFAPEIVRLRGRFTADSRADLELLRALDRDMPVARSLGAWLEANPDLRAGETPEEILIQFEAGGTAIDPRAWRGVLESFSSRDDALLTITLGGARGPLAIPTGLSAMLREARNAGALGLNLEIPISTLAALPQPTGVRALLDCAADVITVAFDSATLASAAIPGFDALLESRRPPFVVASIPLENATTGTWERFYERFHARLDGIVARSPETPAGAVAPEALGAFQPPERFACLRLVRQMRVLADGRVPLCNRDPGVTQLAGSLLERSVAEIWQGGAFRAARRAHSERQFAWVGHCAECSSWCRLD